MINRKNLVFVKFYHIFFHNSLEFLVYILYVCCTFLSIGATQFYSINHNFDNVILY